MKYIVQKTVKDRVHEIGCKIAKEGLIALDERIESIILQAKRNAGGKKTIIREDIILAK